MNAFEERSRSCWLTAKPIAAPPLDKSLTTDAVIVGSGIAGASTAYELVVRGLSVVIVDRGALARGMTARTTAHLSNESDDRYHDVISRRGLDRARLHYESQSAAIDRIETIQRAEGIECNFARLEGLLALVAGTDASIIDKELEACRQIGFDGVRPAGGDLIERFETKHGITFPRQARIHPLKYVDGVLKAVAAKGAQLFADTPVVAVEEDDKGATVRTERGHVIQARAAVLATNSPIDSRLAIHSKQAPYRTYVIAAVVAKGAIVDALYWDTEEPYHYVRLEPRPEDDLLIVGGEDHKPGKDGSAEDRFARLEQWTRERFPEIGDIAFRWSGQVIEPIDYTAFIGPSPGRKHVFVATGDSGQGITHGALAGLILSDLILGEENRWSELHEPARKTLKAAGTLLSENLAAVESFGEYVTPGELKSADDCKPGEGGVLRQGIHKIAVCRDRDGRLHRHSASCAHAGCIVHWNAFEQCWDCPCHGSHFAPDGSVLNAPAIAPLSASLNK